MKPTNTGLLLHYDSHVDNRYKKSLIITMLDQAFKLLSNWSLFHEECILSMLLIWFFKNAFATFQDCFHIVDIT